MSLSVVTITWGQELSELPKRLVYQVVISQDSVHSTYHWYNSATYSGFSIHHGTLLHSKSQYTTVKHSRKLFEYT
jgi:hypothetical protein